MNNYTGPFYWVVVEDGRMFIHDPNGNRLKGEIVCEVTDQNGVVPKATFTAVVNIAGSVEEMEQRIKEMNK